MEFDLPNVTDADVAEIVAFAREKSGSWFDPEAVGAFERLCGEPRFWNDMRTDNIVRAVQVSAPSVTVDMPVEKVVSISSVFSAIIDAKSKFTAQHSRELMEKAGEVAAYLGFEREHCLKFQIAANLHDIGKLAVPLSVLEKPFRLTDREFGVIREHAYITHLILKEIEGFEEIHEWAAHHHERLDGSGYPFGKRKHELPFEAALLASLDMYQALVETRPYRGAMEHAQAMGLLYEEVEAGKMHREAIEAIDRVFGGEQISAEARTAGLY
jgi:HD-GYP domain-containing protein (c-di-GMP phosphodiesterase class II)